MPKLYLGEAIGLIAKTLPFIWVRLGSYLLLGLGLGVYFAVVGGIAWVLGQLWAPLGFLLFLLAVVGAFGIVRWVTRYYFYLLKAAHTSVMTEFIVNGRGPEGSQIEYGKKQVTDRFRDTSVMFAVDVLVDGVVRAFTRSFVRIASILPIPGMNSLGNIVQRIAVMSSTYIDESILSRAYKEREQNVWKVAHDGVILYAQAWKPIVANAVVLALIAYVEFALLLVILGLPALAIAAALPALRVVLAIGVIIGAWMIKLAVADAFSLAATLIAYHRSTEGMEPDPEWKGRLENVSSKFKELGQKAAEGARDWSDRGAETPPDEAPPQPTPRTDTPVPGEVAAGGAGAGLAGATPAGAAATVPSGAASAGSPADVSAPTAPEDADADDPSRRE